MPARKKSDTVAFKLRMKEPLRARIERSARSHGVSMNVEIADRLAQSFEKEEARYQEFGDKRKFDFFKALAGQVTLAETIRGHSVFSDSDTLAQVIDDMVSFTTNMIGRQIPGGFDPGDHVSRGLD